MLLNEIKPSPFLTDYIRLYRIIDFYFPNVATVPVKAYPPRPEHCLQFMAKDLEAIIYPDSGLPVSPKSVVFMGPHTKMIHRYPGKEFLAFQVIFQPGAICQLTNTASSELTNLYLDAEDLFGKGIHLVNEQLFFAKNYTEMVGIVECFLIEFIKKRKQKQHPVDEISKGMIQEHNKYSLDKFLKAACLSHRQFDRKFKERIGLAPKQFLQLSRFDKAFRMKNRFPQMDWLSVAVYCGFYDYQHLVKDYKEFTGCTPAQFFAIDNQAPERALGHVEI